MSSKVPLVKKLPRYLLTLSKLVFSQPELAEIISDFACAINDPLDADANIYIQHLVEKNKITEAHIQGTSKMIKRYWAKSPSAYEIGVSLQHNGYISHLSAAFIHKLVDEKPFTIYIATEGSERVSNLSSLTQQSIDAAFRKPQRHSLSNFKWEDYTFVLLNSPNIQNAGIEKKENYSITNLERTLLDMTVRPAYSGGPQAILQAYQKALPVLFPNQLLQLLDTLPYIYPYHQSVGFYLTAAGFMDSVILDRLRSKPMPYRFYLDYGMDRPLFSTEWNIYYPRDINM